MDKKNKTLFSKVKGVVLLEAFLALLLMAMASYGLATVNSVQFSQMAAGKDADLARNYAELEAEYIKSLGFDAVVTDNKDEDEPSRTPRYPEGAQSSVDKAANARDMTKFLGETLGSEWRSTATLGKTISNINGDSDNMIQNVVVSVYKASDGDNASPRATITVPLSSSSSQGNNYSSLDFGALIFINFDTHFIAPKDGIIIAGSTNYPWGTAEKINIGEYNIYIASHTVTLPIKKNQSYRITEEPSIFIPYKQ